MAYLEAMRDPDYQPDRPEKRLRWGCSALGWAIFAIVLVLVGVFAVKFFNYYQKIKTDGYVELPQAYGSLSARSDVIFGTAQTVVPDSELLTDDSASYGAPADQAKLTVVEFGDFGCPFCKQVSLPLRTIVEKYKDQVRLVYRHYPSDTLHPNATQAAQAAECAGEQGRFWAMYDKLFLNSPNLAFDDLLKYGAAIGLDTKQFEICLVDERYLPRVERDLNAARSLGLRGTPTFFFNGQSVAGALPAETLERVFQMFLSQDR